MIVGTIIGLSILVTVAVETNHASLSDTAARIQMSSLQKDAVIQPLIRSSTDCIVRAITADPKFRSSMQPGDINELIILSMDVCIESMRTMIEAHDRLYGEGSGHAFFMGPYLDVLPAAVSRQVRGNIP